MIEPAGVLPQAAWRLDARPEIGADEVRIRVERLNLDAASFRQLAEKLLLRFGWAGWRRLRRRRRDPLRPCAS